MVTAKVSALLGRIPSAVGYQPTLATDLASLQVGDGWWTVDATVEGQVDYPIIYRVLYIQTVVGNGISEASTVGFSDFVGCLLFITDLPPLSPSEGEDLLMHSFWDESHINM